MNTASYHKISKQIFNKYINLNTVTRNLKKNTCEEEDCCGNIIEKCKPSVVVERTCHPCCFETWKPKLPNLLCPPKPPVAKKPHKMRICHAGMVTPKPKTIMDIKREAKECFKECGAKPICPPITKPLTKKVYKQFEVPPADWDHDGCM